MSGPALRRGGRRGVNVNATKKRRTQERRQPLFRIFNPKKRAASLLENQERVLFRTDDNQKRAGGGAHLWCCIKAEGKNGERSMAEKKARGAEIASDGRGGAGGY